MGTCDLATLTPIFLLQPALHRETATAWGIPSHCNSEASEALSCYIAQQVFLEISHFSFRQPIYSPSHRQVGVGINNQCGEVIEN